ncbi:MAG TPA: OmpH family outer membrane protein [Ferruginibacter sp.]|nr:OmpH family outer membrane protein [Ferruginibacter sp.]HMP21238.1 OmpH family outer membrane protein [Ferruginibacter sp.]
MKQFSSILNVVLIAAVALLYYFHFSGNKKDKQTNAAVKHVDSCIGTQVIAYIDLDSLNNNVDYIKQRKKELEQEQSLIVNEYQGAYQQMEADRNNFIKRGNAITQQEAEEFQEKLQQRQQMVESSRQMKSQKLAEKSAKAMDDMQTKLKAFLNDYNKDKRYSYILATGTGLDYLFYKDSAQNITQDVIKGLNAVLNKKTTP